MKKIVVKKFKDKLVPAPDNIKREFEQVLTSGGLFKIVSKGPTMFGNFHYQILSLKQYEEPEFEKIYKIMSNKFREFERKYGATATKHSDIPVTWNFGYQKDKYISAGVDLYQMWVEDSVKDSKVKDSTYYVYLHSPYGTELIGSGSLEQCKKIKENKDKDWQRGDMWHTEITNKKIEEYSMYDSTNLSSLDKSYLEKINDRLHWNDADSYDGYLHGNESRRIKEIIKKYNIQENEFKSIAPYIYKAYGYKYLLSLNDSINDEDMDYNKFRKALLNAESKAKLKEIKEQVEDYYDKNLINEDEYKRLMRTYDNMIVTPLDDACEVKDSNGYIYLFPDEPAMGHYKYECKRFGLEFLGKNNFNGEKNLVIRGSLSNLKRYAEYLGYDLHPDYIYKPNEFAGDITDACEVKDSKIYYVIQINNKYVGWDDKLYGDWSEFVRCFNKPEEADKYAKSLDLNNYKIKKYDYENKKVLDENPYERAEEGLKKELHDEAKYCYIADPDEDKQIIESAKKLGCKFEKIGGLLKVIASSKVLSKLLKITEDELIKYADRPMSTIRKYSDSIKDSKEDKIVKIHRVITIFKKVTSKDSKVKDGPAEDVKAFYDRLQKLNINSSESELYKALTDAPQILSKLETSLAALKKQIDVVNKKYQETGDISDKEEKLYYSYDNLKRICSSIGNFFNNSFSSNLATWFNGRITGYRFGEEKTEKFVNAAGNIAGKFKSLANKYFI